MSNDEELAALAAELTDEELERIAAGKDVVNVWPSGGRRFGAINSIRGSVLRGGSSFGRGSSGWSRVGRGRR